VPDQTNEHTQSTPLFEYRRQMSSFPLSAATSALIIVDLQNGSAEDGCGFARAFRAINEHKTVDRYHKRMREIIVPNVQKLQASFRKLGAPIIFLTVGSRTGDYTDMPRQYARSVAYWRSHGIEPPYAIAGSHEIAVLEDIAPLPGETVLIKTTASAFTTTALESILNDLERTELVLCGVSTNYCVHSTLRDAADRGFDCVLVEDACADVTAEAHQLGIAASQPFCRVSNAADVVAELTDPRQTNRPTTVTSTSTR
jgi:nicotinamidase-related amidase